MGPRRLRKSGWYFLFATIVFAAPPAQAKSPEGDELRALAAQIVRISEEPRKDQARELREAIADHPTLIAWLKGNRDPRRLFKDADLDAFFTPPERKPSRIESLGSLFMRMDFGSRPIVEREENLAMLEKAPDDVLLGWMDHASSTLERVKLSDSSALREMISPENMGQISGFPPERVAELRKIVLSYFDHLPIVDKREMIARFLELPPGTPLEKQIGVLLQSTGPAMQKLFQLIGDENRSPQVRAAAKELLSDIRPFPGHEAKTMLEKSVGRPLDSVFSSFDETPLKAASVGQVHSAKLKDGQDVIVKVLRPGIRDRARREIAVLREVVGEDPALQDFVNHLEEGLLSELDLRKEAANIALGRGYRDERRGIGIADLAEGIPPSEDVMVIQRARGAAIADADSSSLLARGQAVSNLLESWFERAVYGDGFFHADLHSKNLFFEPVRGGNPPYRVTMIDFGSADRLTPADQRAFVKLSMAVLSKSPERTVEALEELGSLDEASRKRFLAKYRQFYSTDLPFEERMAKAMSIAVENGLKLRRNLMQFNRGRLFLEKALSGINKELDRTDPAGKMPRFKTIAIYGKVSAKRIGMDMSHQALQQILNKMGVRGAPGVDEAQSLPPSYWLNLARENRDKIFSTSTVRFCFGEVSEKLHALLAH